MQLYESPSGLYGFQAEAVARLYYRDGGIVMYDAGLGKSHIKMALAALLFEDDKIDVCLIVCERNKVPEFVPDFAKYTKLTVGKYHGDVKRRARLRETMPQVLVTTYETVRQDCAMKRPGSKRALDSGPLTEALIGKRVLICYDESTKLRNRSSTLYRHHEHMVRMLRKADPGLRVAGFTATPVERDPEQTFNQARLIEPSQVGTVAQFEEDYIAYRDDFGRPRFQNLTTSIAETGIVPLRDRLAPLIIRKRKTDPDVINEFPKKTEEFFSIELTKEHKEFYDAVEAAFTNSEGESERALYTLLRQVAGHPQALLHSSGAMARKVVDTVGPAGIKALESAKTEELVERLKMLTLGQGAQVIVFTFFGRSVLPVLYDRLKAEGLSVVQNHSELTMREVAEAKQTFRAGEAAIYLTGDGAQKGVNLPEASYVCMEETTPVLTSDLRWVPVGSLEPGDGILGCEEDRREGWGRERSRRWQLGKVTKNVIMEKDCLEITLSNGETMVVTPEHRMIVQSRKGTTDWVRADEMKIGWRVPKYMQVWEPETSFDAGWVSGMFDGEGCYSRSGRSTGLHVAQNPGVVLDHLRDLVTNAGYQVREQSEEPARRIKRFYIQGGRAEQARFLGSYRPVRLIEKWQSMIEDFIISAIEYPEIVSIEPVGKRRVAVMETSTGTFVGAGYMQHNCHYELPLFYSQYLQRSDRIHRIDSVQPTSTVWSFIAADTIEEPISATMMRTNGYHDDLFEADDDGFERITAAERRAMLRRVL